MRIVRTFHPVGQGAFYSERFYLDDNDACCNVVYDCGTLRGYLSKAKKLVSNAFAADAVIDYLFLSHLDYDHISLVETLIASVKQVKKIVLPLICEEDLKILLALNDISGRSSWGLFWRRLLRFIQGRKEHQNERNIEYIFIKDIKDPLDNRAGQNVFNSGTPFSIPDIPDWTFIPRCVSYQSRRDALIQSFSTLFSDRNFINALKITGLSIKNEEELYGELKKSQSLQAILDNAVLRDSIKKSYEKVEGGTNGNSLIVYSGPIRDGCQYHFMNEMPREDEFCYWSRREVGCLYTGDSVFDLLSWRRLFASNWERIGTIQVPHHGSDTAFDVSNNPIDRPYAFPISCGGKNSFGHPSIRVLLHLVSNWGYPIMVTEMVNTVYIQAIIITFPKSL